MKWLNSLAEMAVRPERGAKLLFCKGKGFLRQDLAALFYLIGAVEISPWGTKVKDLGIEQSLCTIDFRTQQEDGPLTFDQARFVGQQLGLWYLIHYSDCQPVDFILEISQVGTPLVLGFSEAYGVSIISSTEGVSPDDRILIIADTLTTGLKSKVDVITKPGLDIEFVTIVDQGCSEEFKGHVIHSMFSLPELIDAYHTANIIPEEVYREIMAYNNFAKDMKKCPTGALAL